MKVSVIISACANREELFDRSLYTYTKQYFSREDFEIILIDDHDRNELFNLCKEYHDRYKLKFQYVKIDPKKSFYPVKSFTPALTNNVGFRVAAGDVVVITGPETLQAEKNILVASVAAGKNYCAYGLVFKANNEFNEYLVRNPEWKKYDFSFLINIPGAQTECRTCPPHPPKYWYFMAVDKRHVFRIGGVDERFLGGICGEDDDFSNRMYYNKISPLFDHRIVGIHQNHDSCDVKDKIHSVKFDEEVKILKNHNMKLLRESMIFGNPVANKNHEWGNLNTIVEKEILY